MVVCLRIIVVLKQGEIFRSNKIRLKIKNEDLLLRFEKLNRRIDQSEKDFENGGYKTTSEMLKKLDF